MSEKVNQSEYPGFLKTALAMKGSVTPLIINKVLVTFFYALLISLINWRYPDFSIPIGPSEYAGLILGVILVFRINAGYDRWWEARQLWGGIVNASRNFLVSMTGLSGDPAALQIRSRLFFAIGAMPVLIKDHLRREQLLPKDLSWPDEAIQNALDASANRVLALSGFIEQWLQEARQKKMLDDFTYLRLTTLRADLIGHLGACERILNTPMPFVMAVKTRRFILLFLLFLPLALVNVSAWMNPLISMIVAYAIFSIDRIGLELQSPFSKRSLSHLPLDGLCEKIQRDVLETATFQSRLAAENGVA